jgi:arsenite methyltransferase
MSTITPEQIHEEVRQRYGLIAETFTPTTQSSCCGPTPSASSSCCTPSNSLYETDLSNLPTDVTELSLGCGDPIALAALQPGQVVLDLGSGGGIDCFLAAQQVGPEGRVIGVDMTPAMLEKANNNKAKLAATNVEFRHGQIEALPVESDTVDVIISNCVINLSPDKAAVFREAYRVLKPGGRLSVSDIVTQGHFTPQQRTDMAGWAACLNGAEDVNDYVAAIAAAGFSDIVVEDKSGAAMSLLQSLGQVVGQPKLMSARVTAVKQPA